MTGTVLAVAGVAVFFAALTALCALFSGSAATAALDQAVLDALARGQDPDWPEGGA